MGLLKSLTGGILGSVGSIANGIIGAKASKKASKKMAKAIQAAIDNSNKQFASTEQSFSPYLASGTAALDELQDPNRNFLASPDYEFRRSEGERGIGNSFAARGWAFSGNALRALSEFNSNLASSEFGNWFDRKARLAGAGQDAVSTLGGLRADNTANIANMTIGKGEARASGIIGSANALTRGISGAIDNWNYFGKTPSSKLNAYNYTGSRYGGYA